MRLELTASAYHSTVYKYGALTDCVTGAYRNERFVSPYINHSAVYILFWSVEISDNILRNPKEMFGLDSYSRQVFIYFDQVLIYISL